MASSADVNAKLTELGEIVLALVPQDFSRVLLKAELDYGWAALDCRSWSEDGTEKRASFSGRSSYDLHMVLDSLRKLMAGPDGAMWTHCQFSIEQDRSFKFDVDYPEG